MKISCIMLSLLAASLAQASSDFTFSASELYDANKSGNFFDPHNHTGGVLNSMAVINGEKFIRGERLSELELKNFWFKFMKFFDGPAAKKDSKGDIQKDADGKVIFTEKVNKLKSGPQLSNGTKLVLNCDEPSLYCSSLLSSEEEDGEQCYNALLKSITNILAATPLTGFGGAYAVRRNLTDVKTIDPEFPLNMGFIKQQSTILELALARIGLVEMSETFISEEKARKKFWGYKKILDDLSSSTTSVENKELKDRFVKQGLQVPQIKWLLATNTQELGKTSDTTRLSYITGHCTEYSDAVAKPDTPSEVEDKGSQGEAEEQSTASAMATPDDMRNEIYNTLLKSEDAVGVDVAGPEYTCFARHGMEEFKKLAATTYRASVARQKKYDNKAKLVVRAHVGEGAPVPTDPPIIMTKADERNQACEEIKKFPTMQQVHNRGELVYIHQNEARRNIDYMLKAIGELKQQYADIDKYIIFRLGHLTHITNVQAKLAKELGVSADINLSSNVSTQAWTVDRKIIDKYLIQKGTTANNTRSLLAALVANGATYPEIFNGHGLKWLLLNKVPTTLGTDGAGVEHAPSMKREYLIADELIKAWNKDDPEFKKQAIDIDFLLKSQKDHLEQMGYKF